MVKLCNRMLEKVIYFGDMDKDFLMFMICEIH